MKSYILHGENHPASRQKLSEITKIAKNEDIEVRKISGKNLTKESLETHARSQSLISQGQLLVIENFFKGKRNVADSVLELSGPEDVGFVFWEDRKLTPATLRKLQKGFEIQEFKVPVAIFKFLDSLALANAQTSLQLLRQATDRDSADFLLIMMARHVRLLVWAKEDPETLKVAPWQKGNLIHQSEQFSKHQLMRLHKTLLETDRENKHSRLPENLNASLELLVAAL